MSVVCLIVKKRERKGEEKRREGGGLVYLEVLASHRASSGSGESSGAEELGALEWLGAYLGDTVHLFTTVPTPAGGAMAGEYFEVD